MIRPTPFLTLALALLAMATSTPAIAQAPVAPSDTGTSALADKARQNPDDTAALSAFFGAGFREIAIAVQTDSKAAGKKLGALKEQVEALAPTRADAKTLVQRAKSTLAYYEEQVAVKGVTLSDLEDRLKANPDDADALKLYAAKALQDASNLVRSDPDAATKQVAAIRAFLTEVKAKSSKPETGAAVAQAVGRLASLTASIAAEKTRANLVGKAAAPLDVETWVNGSPITDEDLKGKVVLLDFWAVWCGPCIATFPHLREWNAKYADKGLVIIGVTNYYNFAWDEKADKATPSPDGKVAPEKEQAMLVKFAAQHKLTHRFGIQKARALSEYYGVTGIPQAVVIDREGIVRLIRVGSGEPNARAIGDMLEKLIGPAKDAAD